MPCETNGDHSELLEALAALEHDRWSRWMQYLFTKGRKDAHGRFTIDAASVEHWERQVGTAYADLTEREKDSDRREARNSLEIVVAHRWGAPGKHAKPEPSDG